MNVKMLRNPAADLGCPLLEGQVGEVEQKLGERLIKLGIAIESDEEPTDLKGVSPAPAIAEARPANLLPKDTKKTAEPAVDDAVKSGDAKTSAAAEAQLKDYKNRGGQGGVK